MSLPNFPCIRKTNSVPGKPMFVSDAIIADSGIMSAMSTLLNDSTGFHILSGMAVVGSAISAGIVSLGGVIYYCPGCTIGQYLIPNLVDVDSRLHSDGNSYVTYREYQVQAAGSPSSGSSPQLTALTIDNYRVDLNLLVSKSLKTGSSNTLTVTLTSATPVVGADSQAASVVANISSNYSGTVEYDYHIGINTNIIYFNVTSEGYYAIEPVIFKIYNSSNVLIKTLTTAGVLTNWKFLAINDGTTWHFITGTDDLLGDAAFKDVGTSSISVCSGNDVRLPSCKSTYAGDKVSADYISGITYDSSWHTLDLTSKSVPTTAVFVILCVGGSTSDQYSTLLFKQYGNSDTFPVVSFSAYSADSAGLNYRTIIVPMSLGKIIANNHGQSDFTSYAITIMGWF